MKNLICIAFIGAFLLSACNSADNKIQLVNNKAALPVSFKFDNLGLKVMASFINKRSGTMSVLYANPLVLNNAIKGNKEHRSGEILALVSWKQQEDNHWFGAKIPGVLQSVEVVKTVTVVSGLSTTYQKYTGKELRTLADTVGRNERIKYILNLQPAVMP